MPKLLDITKIPGFENYVEPKSHAARNAIPDFEKYRAQRLAELDAEEKRINNKLAAIKAPSVMYGGENQIMVQRASLPAEYSQYNSALKQLDDTRNTLKTYTESDYKRDQAKGVEKGFVSRLIDGATNVNADDVIPFNPILQLNSADLNRTLRKAQNGGTLNDAEQTLLKSALGSELAMADIRSQGGATKAGAIGQSLPQSVKFMTETAILNTLFPVIGNSVHAAKGVAQISKAAGKYFGNSAIREAGLATLRSNTWETAVKRQKDQYVLGEGENGSVGVVDYKPENVLKSIYLGWADSATEGISERFGGLLETKALGKLAPKILGAKIGGAIEKIGQSKVGGLVSQWDDTAKKIFNWNGTINEYIEEKFNDAIKPLLTWDDSSWRTFFDARENLITLGSVAVMGSTAIITKAPAMAVDHLIKDGTLKKEATNHLKALSTPELKSAIQSAGAEQTLNARYEKLMSVDWSIATKQDAIHAIDYINARTQYDIIKGSYQVRENDAQNTKIMEDARAEYMQLANPDTGMIEVVKGETGGHYQVLYDRPASSHDSMRFAENLETHRIEQIDITKTVVEDAIDFDTYIKSVSTRLEQTIDQASREDMENDIRAEATEAGVDPTPAILSSRGVDLAKVVGSYAILEDGRRVHIVGNDGHSYIGKWEDPQTLDEQDVEVSPDMIVSVQAEEQTEEQTEEQAAEQQPQVSPPVDVEPQIPTTEAGAKDYDAMPSDMLARELETDLGHDAAAAELSASIKYADSQIKNISNRKSGSLNERVKRYAKINEWNARKDTLQAALEALQPTVAPPAKTGSDLSGDYLSLDDYILRDIAAGLKFVWNDNGSMRGLAHELGFVGSEGERRNRISMLRNDGITVDQYAESIVKQLGGDLPNWNIDVSDARSAIIDILSKISSPKQARNEALALRNRHDESQYYDSRYEDAINEESVRDDLSDDSPLATDPVRDAATSQEKTAAVTQLLTDWNSRFGIENSKGITAFDNNSFDALPEKVQKAFKDQWTIEKLTTPGVTFGENVYLYIPHIRDVADLEATYVHEVLCHRAINRAVGNVMNEALFYADLVDNIGVSEMVKLNEDMIQRLADSYFMDQEPKTKISLGREYVAYLTNQRVALNDFRPQTTDGVYVVNGPIRTAEQVIDLVLTINSAKNGRGTIQGLRNFTREVDFDRGLHESADVSRVGTKDIRTDSGVQGSTEDSAGVPRNGAMGSIGTSPTNNSETLSTGGQLREVGGIEPRTAPTRENLITHNNATSTTIPAERNRQRENELSFDETAIPDRSITDSRQRGTSDQRVVTQSPEQSSRQIEDSPAGIRDVASAAGEPSDNSIYQQKSIDGPTHGNAGDINSTGDVSVDLQRTDVSDRFRENSDQTTNRNIDRGVDAKQLESIRHDLPQLYKEQQEDVLFAEKRFFIGNNIGKGVLFTNGTGTGKTFTGLGVVKRFVLKGRNEIIIVVPTDTKAKDWIEDGHKLGLDIYQLLGVKDIGQGITITTYANFCANSGLQKRNFDLVVYDESHYLGQGKDGEAEAIFRAHRINAKLPSYIKQQVREELQYLLPKSIDNETAQQREVYRDAMAQWEQKVNQEVQKRVNSVNVVFLSATPFAYHSSLKYVDGTLIDVEETIQEKQYTGGYNTPSGFGEFLTANLGYRMRYNKVTRPESGVDIDLLERQLHEKLKSEGVLSGRKLEVDKDYSRNFVLVNSEIGEVINNGMKMFYDYSKDGFRDNYKTLCEYAPKKWNYLYVDQLLETIKATQSVKRIKDHLGMNRKVVVFYSYNNALPSHPFHFDVQELLKGVKGDDYHSNQIRMQLNKEISAFNKEYPEYYNLDIGELSNLRSLFKQEFGDRIAEFNGVTPKAKRNENKRRFNQVGSGVDILLIQRKAGKEGISLHDTDGVNQRVLIDLGLPVAPTDAIQTEGRIYRLGTKSDAIFEYPVIKTDFEINAYASKIAERVRTPENLAMGNQARDLENAFREGYVNAQYVNPQNMTGVGGKETDMKVATIDDFDRAKTYYYARQKRTSSTKSMEGVDYFATPEPVGLKMVEWLGLHPNDDVLEPSAGHGAIARFFPADTNNTFIEPGYQLATQVSITAHGEVKQINFEDHSIWNKYDAIAMNPPFGTAGKTAMEHVEKAFKHLKHDGRIVAIIPTGSGMNKRLDGFLYGEDAKGHFINPEAQLVADIALPSATFSRAGTNVSCRIVVIDKVDPKRSNPNVTTKIDLSDCTTVEELFDRIKNIELPKRMDKSSNVRFREEQTSQTDRIKSEAIANGTFLKAPNGKHTNLTERQWLQVRTKAFKEWFGDWEKTARIEKLRNSTPIEINGNEIAASDDLKKYRRNAFEYGKTITGKYTNDDTGATINLTGGSKIGGLREILHHDNRNIAHLQSIAAIPQIIKDSIFITSIDNENKTSTDIASYDYYVCGLKIGNEDYTVKAVVANSKDGIKYYDHKLTNIEKGQLLTLLEGLSTPSADSNSPLSDIKDNRLISILQNNSSKVVDANGEPMVVYHGSRSVNSFWKFDGNASFFTDDRQTAEVFKSAASHAIIIDGKEHNIDLSTAEDIKSILEPYETLDWIVGWNLREVLTGEQLQHIEELIGIGNLDAANEIRVEPSSNTVFELFLNIRNPKIQNYQGRTWGESDTVIEHDIDRDADGFIALNIREGGLAAETLTGEEMPVQTTFVIFSPNQIKSAIANIGTYDENSADIRFHEAGATAATSQQSADRIEKAICDAEKTFGIEVVRVAARSELPRAVRTQMNPSARYSGAYHDGKVYMLTGEITDPDDATATYLHEVIAHKGIAGLLGEEKARKLYDSVFHSLDDTTQKRLLSRYGDSTVAGDEYVARMAEGDVSPSVMQRIIGAIRRFFKEVLGLPLRISDNDIRYILWKSKNNLKNARTLGDSMRIIARDQRLRMELFDPVRFRERTITQDQQQQITEGKTSAEIAAINLREVLQDNLIRVKLMQDKLRASGGSIDITKDGYTALNRLESVTKAAMDRFERRFMKPLAQFIRTMSAENEAPITYTEVSDYVNAKHSIERHDSGVSALSDDNSGEWTREHTQNIVSEFESRVTPSKLDELWRLVHSATNEMLRINVESGIMTDEKAREYKARWKYYVPLRGKDFEFEQQQDLSKYYDYITSNYQGKTVRDTLSTKAKGRISKADDPLATIHHLGFMTIMYAERNKALMYFMRQVQANNTRSDLFSMSEVWYRKTPDGQWYETNDTPSAQEIKNSIAAKREATMAQNKLREAVKNHESADLVEKLEEKVHAATDRIIVNKVAYAFGSGYQGLSQSQKNEHFVYVMKNGVKQRIHYTDPAIADAINDINDSVFNHLAKTKFGQLIGRGTRALAALSTSKNPAFIAANYLRDIQHAYTYSLVDSEGEASAYLRHAFTSFKPIHRALTETENPLTIAQMAGYDPTKIEDRAVLTERYGHDRVQDTLYDLFVTNGGKTGFLHIEDMKEYGQKLQRMANGDPNNLVKVLRGVNAGLDYMAEMSETSTRFAVFLSQIDAKKDVLTAVNYAKDITVNFNRKGKWGKGLGVLYLFLNAGVQGSANAAGLGWHNKLNATFAIAALAVMGFANSMLLEYLLSGDDDERWNISDYVRRTNIIIYAPFTEQGYIKIPIPILFRPAWNLGLTASDFMNGRIDAPQAVNSIFSVSVDGMSPVDFTVKDPLKVVLPTIVRPLYEVGVSNTDFKGSKINRVPYLSSQEGYVPDSQLGQPYVNSILKTVTTNLNKLGGGSEFVPAGMNEDGTTNWFKNQLDISPSTIEHLIGQYTGGVGREIMHAWSFVTDGEARKQARNIPILNRFYTQAYKENPSKEYYDIKRILKNTDIMRKSLNNGDPIMGKTLSELKRAVDAKQKYVKRMKDIDKNIKSIEKRMEPLQEGTPEFDRYRNEIEQLQKDFIKYYNDNND